MTTILEDLAKRTSAIELADLDETEIRIAEACLFDLIGVTLGALARPEAAALLSYAEGLDTKGSSPIWGTGIRAPAAEAAMINGALGYMLEFDDGITLGGHWSSSAIPAILALSAQRDSGYEEIVVAIVAAVEAGTRISRSLSRPLLERGIHFPGLMGSFAGIAGAARILGLSPADTAAAMGHACLIPVAPYVAAHGGAHSKNLFSGWSNLLAIQSVRMVQAGFTGPTDLLEGKDGLASALGWSGTAEDLAATVLASREGFYIRETYFKKFPCCRWFHAPIDAILELRSRVMPDDVESIVVRAPDFLKMYAGPAAEIDAASAKYHLGYCCASALISGSLDEDAFLTEEVARRDLLDLSNRVRFKADSELQAAFPADYRTTVELHLKSGHALTHTSTMPWSFREPPAKTDLKKKFGTLVSGACTSGTSERWLRLYDNGLATPGSIQELSDLLDLPSGRASGA